MDDAGRAEGPTTEAAAFDALLRRRVTEALADPRPDLSADEVDTALLAHHRRRSGCDT